MNDFKFAKYFRNALAVQNRNTIDFKNFSDTFRSISMDDFEKGYLSPDVLDVLCPIKENKKDDIHVIFSVKTILTEFTGGVEIDKNIDELTGVFYVPAKITYVGEERKLVPALAEKKLPWIPRKFLDPVADPILVLGESKIADEFFENTTAKRKLISCWYDYVTYCKDFFYKVTGTALKWKEDYRRKIKYEDNVFVFVDKQIEAVKQLINIYDNIIQNHISSELFHKYMECQESEKKDLLSDSDVSLMLKHHGQMNGMYPLAESQRRVLNHINCMNSGDIIAVSGPPGTGKTTLLQSVVADMYVKAAIMDKTPPVIVASSSNNQAVTNIIESFGKIKANAETNLERRWVTVADGFAVYFPSKNKEKEALAKNYQITRGGEWNNFVRTISDSENIKRSKNKMLQEASAYFQTDFIDLIECKKVIGERLKKIEAYKVKLLKLRSKSSIFDNIKIENILWELKQIGCNIFEIPDGDKKYYIKQSKTLFLETSIYQLNELIDKHIRYMEFWLAVHYFECKYLEGEHATTDKQKATTIADVYKKIYCQIALLSPCMVMTFHSMPNNFKVYDINEKKHTYLYRFIDLLIIDEAGQVSPEIAAASFALAQKALVVGDEEQIPPVWNVDRALDMGLAQSAGLIKDREGHEKLIEIGLNCFSSSVMKIAKKACYYSEKNVKGLFLSEHRRCYDEIIEYCNELVYGGQLKPSRGCREKMPKPYWPVMGHYTINTERASMKGTSRINIEEAKRIAFWLSENYECIENYYCDENPRQIIAIITPFKEQVSVIKKWLKEYMPDKEKCIDVGTVHTFQGADRRIIILSTVYGKLDGCPFIDKNPALMNVAVSRAKDAFWIFGDYECLKEAKDFQTASGKLRRYVSECLPMKLN